MRKIIPLLFTLSSLATFAFAQNVKDETIEYNYIQLPLQPLDKSIKTYQASIFATYEEENARKKAEYEAEKKAADDAFKKDTEEYPAKVKAAEDKYAAEMAEWDKKSLADKVVEKKVLGEDNKPVKRLPPQPYLRSVNQPVLQTSYDYPVVANTYLILGGFENKAGNGVTVKVTIHGFDYTQPRQMTTQKTMTSYVNGQSTNRQVTYYYTEFSYRHPMSVVVTLADGTVILNATPQELNTYVVYKTAETETPSSINTELLIKTNEEKVFQSNLTFINNLVNDKIGFQKVKRNAKLYYVKSKDDTYQDLQTAFNEASSGLKLLADDEANGKPKVESAVKTWNTALAESDPENKKARIDKNVTVMLCFNLLEANYALRNADEADKMLVKLNAFKLSYEEKKMKEDFELKINDLKKRLQANK